MKGFSDIQDNVWLNNAVLKRQVTLYQTSLFDPVLAERFGGRFQPYTTKRAATHIGIPLKFFYGQGVR